MSRFPDDVFHEAPPRRVEGHAAGVVREEVVGVLVDPAGRQPLAFPWYCIRLLPVSISSSLQVVGRHSGPDNVGEQQVTGIFPAFAKQA